MASKTEIANRTLVKLGQPRVSNIDTDSSARAIAINQIYDTVLRGCLQMYPWNFSIKRTDLAPDALAPSWGFSASFTLPANCLQLLEVKDDIKYQVEGGKVLCDGTDTLYIKYIAYISDAGLYPPIFVEYFSQELAIEACDRITDDTGIKQTLLAQMSSLRERVLATDAIENWPEMLVEDDWLLARL
jgi:hypothetical protein